MRLMLQLLLVMLVLLVLLGGHAGEAQQSSITKQSFTFSSNFSSIDIVVRGLASTQYDSLSLTLGAQGSSRTFYRYPAKMIDPVSNRSVSFNTTFVFQILGLDDNEGLVGDGMVFVLAPASVVEQADDPLRGGTCLAFTCNNYNTQDNYDKPEHMFGVEFDTFMNYCDPDGDHIGININSVNSSAVAQLHLNSSTGQNSSISLHKNMTLQSWIEYRGGDIGNIKVWLAENGSSRPVLPRIDYNLSLHRVIHPVMYPGFSAASGNAGSVQTIYSWSFAVDEVTTGVTSSPQPSRHRSKRRKSLVVIVSITASASLFLSSATGLLLLRRRRRNRVRLRRRKRSSILQLNTLVDYSYKELHIATKGFKEVLGKGGSAIVYKGLLPNTGQLIAVKNLTSNSLSEHQFVAELSIISKVRHQNLVALKGWCYEEDKLMLVYEYMSNGSLDKLLFSKKQRFPWSQRFAIIKSVAEGLAYLHEGLEQRIIHRDVKAANVLLDDDFTGKLGDFGLARFIEQTTGAQTLTKAGTAGYISPELAYTGRATEKSDVFSFGILALEIVARRRAVDLGLLSLSTSSHSEDDRTVLLDWVWELYLNERVLDAVDPEIADEAGDESLLVIQMGLLCCSLDPTERPSMKKCCQVFGGDAEQPPLHGLRPAALNIVTAVYGSNAASVHSSSSKSASTPLISGTDIS